MYGSVLAAAAFIGSLVVYVLAFNESVLSRILLAAATLLFVIMSILIFTLGHAAYELYRASRKSLPAVLAGGDPSAGMAAALVCWLAPSELFSYDIAVSFYSVSPQGFEVLVGVGTVTIVQDDGTIQVAMKYIEEGHEDFAERLRRNEAEALSTTRVKPNVPTGYINF